MKRRQDEPNDGQKRNLLNLIILLTGVKNNHTTKYSVLSTHYQSTRCMSLIAGLSLFAQARLTNDLVIHNFGLEFVPHQK